MEDVKNIYDLMRVLQGPAALLVIVWATSWGLDEVVAWHNLKPKVKSLAILLLACILGGGAVWVSQYPDFLAIIDPYVKVVLSISGTWIGTQVVHEVGKRVKSKKATG